MRHSVMAENFAELFNRWRSKENHKGANFVEDGIIDPKRWNKSKRKILFIFKEAYMAPDKKFTNLCELFFENDILDIPLADSHYKMWWTAALWAYGIKYFEKGKILRIQPFDGDIDANAKVKEALLSCAVIDIKKSGGTSISNNNDLKKYASEDLDLIREEIELVKPNLIICGNTWNLVHQIWTDKKGEDEVDNYDMVYKCEDTYIVDYWHPGGIYPQKMTYYSLMALIHNSGYLDKYKPDTYE